MKKLIKKNIPNSVWESLVYLHCRLIKVQEEIYYFVMPKYYWLDSNNIEYDKVLAVKNVHAYSMIDRKGLLTTYDIAIRAMYEEGCFVECGVARGGCGALMAMVASGYKHTWLFDSYEGLPKHGIEDKEVLVNVPKDKHSMVLSEGYCLGTLQEVQQMLYAHFGLDRRYVHTVKGWFNKTLPEYRNNIGKIALLKLDADWYESVKCCLDNLWDNIVECGYIYIDDYHLSGCQKAISEHINNKGIKPVIYPDGRGGAWFRK